MKKIILSLLLFLALSLKVDAATIDNISININIDANGDSVVNETWVVKSQSAEYFEKIFLGENSKISDINIVDSKNVVFKASESFDKTKANSFTYIDESEKKTLKFTYDGLDNTYKLSYKVKGMISKYTDIQGFNWVVLAKTSDLSVNKLNVVVKFPVALNELNTALYVHGSDAEVSFQEGMINLSALNLNSTSQIRMMTTFNELTFVNAVNIEETFSEYYDSVINSSELMAQLKELLSNTTIKYIVIGVIGIFGIYIILKFLTRFKRIDEFSGIVTENKKTISKLEQVNYYDLIPCNYDLYKIAFLAGYFKILKNRSNIVGATILKWIYEGSAKIGMNGNRPYIKVTPSQMSEKKLDMDLFGMLNAASNHGIIDGSKLTRYANEHYLRVVTWFNMGYHEVINDEFSRGNIKKIKKLKKVELVLNNKLIEEGNQIQGLKRYLLNFNQVPRQTELTEQNYKYLLICAELLGIGNEVAKEILRKNPENAMAKTLLELSNIRYIYKNMYQTALIPYKQVAKLKKITIAYDPEFDNLVNRRDANEPQRTSKL